MRGPRRDPHADRLREVGDPPRQGPENYCAVLAEALLLLDTAWNVAPDTAARTEVDTVRDTLRSQLLMYIEDESGGEDGGSQNGGNDAE